jgi:ribonuclease P protein component
VLFQTGKAFHIFPVKFLFVIVPRSDTGESPVLTGFSVPKKKFKKSVDRHRIRRLMSESWRLNKYLIYPCISLQQQIHLFLIYTGTALPDFETVRTATIKGIGILKERVTPAAE